MRGDLLEELPHVTMEAKESHDSLLFANCRTRDAGSIVQSKSEASEPGKPIV